MPRGPCYCLETEEVKTDRHCFRSSRFNGTYLLGFDGLCSIDINPKFNHSCNLNIDAGFGLTETGPGQHIGHPGDAKTGVVLTTNSTYYQFPAVPELLTCQQGPS